MKRDASLSIGVENAMWEACQRLESPEMGKKIWNFMKRTWVTALSEMKKDPEAPRLPEERRERFAKAFISDTLWRLYQSAESGTIDISEREAEGLFNYVLFRPNTFPDDAGGNLPPPSKPWKLIQDTIEDTFLEVTDAKVKDDSGTKLKKKKPPPRRKPNPSLGKFSGSASRPQPVGRDSSQAVPFWYRKLMGMNDEAPDRPPGRWPRSPPRDRSGAPPPSAAAPRDRAPRSPERWEPGGSWSRWRPPVPSRIPARPTQRSRSPRGPTNALQQIHIPPLRAESGFSGGEWRSSSRQGRWADRAPSEPRPSAPRPTASPRRDVRREASHRQAPRRGDPPRRERREHRDRRRGARSERRDTSRRGPPRRVAATSAKSAPSRAGRGPRRKRSRESPVQKSPGARCSRSAARSESPGGVRRSSGNQSSERRSGRPPREVIKQSEASESESQCSTPRAAKSKASKASKATKESQNCSQAEEAEEDAKSNDAKSNDAKSNDAKSNDAKSGKGSNGGTAGTNAASDVEESEDEKAEESGEEKEREAEEAQEVRDQVQERKDMFDDLDDLDDAGFMAQLQGTLKEEVVSEGSAERSLERSPVRLRSPVRSPVRLSRRSPSSKEDVRDAHAVAPATPSAVCVNVAKGICLNKAALRCKTLFAEQDRGGCFAGAFCHSCSQILECGWGEDGQKADT